MGVFQYQGFDRCPGDSDFKLVPIGIIDDAFYCKRKDLAVAINEVLRYNVEQFGRIGPKVIVTPIF